MIDLTEDNYKSVSFQVNSFLFSLIPDENILLPAYKGSTLRGGFGHAFKRVTCALKNKECINCLLKEKCIYSYIFETPPPSDTKLMRKYRTAPHPFIIEPPLESQRIYKPSDRLEFGLILVGRAIDYLPYFIYTFDELGKIGIGKGKAKYKLSDVSCDGKTIYDSKGKTLKSFSSSILNLEFGILNSIKGFSQTLKLSFITPTRILYNAHLTLDLEFHILIRNLLRRISLLFYFHCGGDTSEWDFRGMIDKAKEIKVKETNLHWYDWQRYSNRQETRIKMGGFIGDITFEGNIKPFISLIKAGEILHVGKGSAFGLGKFRIVKDDK